MNIKKGDKYVYMEKPNKDSRIGSVMLGGVYTVQDVIPSSNVVAITGDQGSRIEVPTEYFKKHFIKEESLYNEDKNSINDKIEFGENSITVNINISDIKPMVHNAISSQIIEIIDEAGGKELAECLSSHIDEYLEEIEK